MQELTHILVNKLQQLNEKLGNKTVPYTDDCKGGILYEIDEVVRDACISLGCTYSILKFDTDTILFEIKDVLYSLVITVLFRNHDIKMFLNCY